MSPFEHECYVYVVRTTELALLCDIEGEEVWIPKNQLQEGSELSEDAEPGDEGTIVIPGWLAEDRSLI